MSLPDEPPADTRTVTSLLLTGWVGVEDVPEAAPDDDAAPDEDPLPEADEAPDDAPAPEAAAPADAPLLVPAC